MSEIAASVFSSVPLRHFQTFSVCSHMFAARHLTQSRPSLRPWSMMRVCANRSSGPFGTGEPVRPMRTFMCAVCFSVGRHFADVGPLNFDSSSITKQSNSPPRCSRKSTRFSWFTTTMSPPTAARSFGVPVATPILRCRKCSHFSPSCCQTSSATRSGAVTSTRRTMPSASISLNAVSVTKVFPAPGLASTILSLRS